MYYKKTKKEKGFTLIELVIVIVILGILSAIALPKYFDLQEKAKLSVLMDTKGKIDYTLSAIYTLAVIQGKEKNRNPSFVNYWDSTSIVFDGVKIPIHYGSPNPVDLYKIIDNLEELDIGSDSAGGFFGFPEFPCTVNYLPYDEMNSVPDDDRYPRTYFSQNGYSEIINGDYENGIWHNYGDCKGLLEKYGYTNTPVSN